MTLTDDPYLWLITSPNSSSSFASLGSPIFEMPGMEEYVLGKKHFEFTNHLGNVMAVATDRKLPEDPGMDGQIDFYNPDVSATYGYYLPNDRDLAAFGMPLANDGNVLLNRNVVNHQEGCIHLQTINYQKETY